MEGTRGPEIPQPTPEPTDEGFSEKRAARILEGVKQDDSQVKKRVPTIRKPAVQQTPKQKSLSRGVRLVNVVTSLQQATRRQQSLKEKVVAAYQKNAEELQELVKQLAFLVQGAFQAQELMMQVRARQKIQEQLLNALDLEGRGQLTKDTLPKELMDLVK